MRILLLVDCYLPSSKSSAKLVDSLARELSAQGHTVTVAAPDDSLLEKRTLTPEGPITVLRARTGRIKGAGKIVRAFNEWRLSSVMWSAGEDYFRKHPCDLVVFYSPTIFFGRLVTRLKRLWRCRTVLILRDIFPKWAVDAGVLREGSLPWRFFRHKELQQYEAADVICVQSPANLEYFRQQGWAAKHRLEVLFNWTQTEGEIVPPSDLRRTMGLEGKVVFFCGGNMGVAQDMDNLFRLAESLRNRSDLFFLFVGEGSEVARLTEVIRHKNLENVAIRPAVDQHAYLGLLSEFDIGMLSLDKRLRTQNFPGKMLGYMHAAMPILASVNPGNDLKDLLESNDAGLVSLNGDDEKLRRNALALADDPELRRRLGQNARQLLEKRFSVRQAAAQLLLFSDLGKGKP